MLVLASLQVSLEHFVPAATGLAVSRCFRREIRTAGSLIFAQRRQELTLGGQATFSPRASATLASLGAALPTTMAVLTRAWPACYWCLR